ncbi:angiotensin-converting enzyme-like [Condylostylus longicornis]|uniref:angiotensin-converting enzyme-like n=1 Tax=Condylostylus longicornis TaxID=2530218 RepID=UPI00244E4328|nr:angiotensin-converting enzyme-like [Condylostylus longicornis]
MDGSAFDYIFAPPSLLQQPYGNNQEEAIQFLHEYDREASEMCNRLASSEWRFETNTTDFNRRRMKEQQSLASKFACISWRKATSINTGFTIDGNIRRQFDRILRQGHCGLGEVKYLELQHVLNLLKDNYNNAKICPFPNNRLTENTYTPSNLYPIPITNNYVKTTTGYCGLKINDLTKIMENSKIEAELRYIWTAWRDVTGPPLRNTFMRYVDLVNQAARIHGFRDAGEQARSLYEDPNFYFTVQDLWHNIQPLYKQLFTFVRRALVRFYGPQIIRPDGPIPAHVFGNMWAQNWQNIFDLIKPGRKDTPNVTSEMIRQGYNAVRIFQAAEEFFTSMGLPPMSAEFWRNSVIQKSNEIYMQCSTSTWDFCNNIDFRVKQCTEVTLEDYINAHKELAHIQYFMHYASQPHIFHDGPNPAFHEAISNSIALSISNPVHLQRIGLLAKSFETESGNAMVSIEYLLFIALKKLPLLAFSLTLERWRWHIFEKGPVGMNRRWWELHLRYMGIIPPLIRQNEHFDAGSKYHVIADEEYIKYFIATILEFQIYSEMCSVSNHVGPLHTCDVYRSREAGRILVDLMNNGASLSTDQLIKFFTKGKTSKISTDALLEYFQPLKAWLEIQNRDENVIGWNSNLDDVGLFQMLKSCANKKINYMVSSIVYIINLIIMFNL